MVEITEALLDQMTQKIVEEVDPEQVILFGSYARGNATEDSDLDLLIVEREPFGQQRSRWKEIERIRGALSPFRIAKDILVYSSDEVEYWHDSLNHIVAECLREGKLLYERS